MLSQRKMLDSSGDQDLIFPPSNACGRQDQVYHSARYTHRTRTVSVFLNNSLTYYHE